MNYKVFADNIEIGSSSELERDDGMDVWTGEFVANKRCDAYASIFKKWADAVEKRADDTALNPLRIEMKKLKLRVQDEQGTVISNMVFISDFRPEVKACYIEAYGLGHSDPTL
jgi:hypothetical protein